MIHTTSIGQVMHTQVNTVKPHDTLLRVDEIFKNKPIHHLPVVDDDGKVVGMISKTDYYLVLDTFTIFRLKDAERINKDIFRSLLVSEVMSQPVVTRSPEDTIASAVDIFRENRFHALPVVNAKKQLVGIVSVFDLLGLPAI
jgi:acetoin utilization protein AcuB